MPKINVREILVLIFISIFVAFTVPILRIFLAAHFLGFYLIFIFPFLFGICSAYIMQKGEKKNFIKKSIAQGLILSFFIFMFTFYFSGILFSYTRNFLDYIKVEERLAKACVSSSDPECKLLIMLLYSKIENNKIHLSMISLLGYLSGILIYSLLVQRFLER